MPKSGSPDCASLARVDVVLSKILAVTALWMARIDAADERTVLAQEGHQVATSINHREIVGDPQARGLCLCGRQHSLRIFECDGVVCSWHIVLAMSKAFFYCPSRRQSR